MLIRLLLIHLCACKANKLIIQIHSKFEDQLFENDSFAC
jgi:hypothetical protein